VFWGFRLNLDKSMKMNFGSLSTKLAMRNIFGGYARSRSEAEIDLSLKPNHYKLRPGVGIHKKI